MATAANFSNMLNEKLTKMRKKGQPTSMGELRDMAKKKGYSKAAYHQR